MREPSLLMRDYTATISAELDPGPTSDRRELDKWRELIGTLRDWLEGDPRAMEDDGIDPPDLAVIEAAMRWARLSQAEGRIPPDGVVRDPNGGIVFERREGKTSEVYHFWDDGAVEYMEFDGTRLKERRTL